MDLDLLDLAVVSQLHLELLEAHVAKRPKRKTLIQQLIKDMREDTLEMQNKLFSKDEETLRIVEQNYEYALKAFAVRNVPCKVLMSQMLQSWELEPNTVEANTHRILKKHYK